MDSGRLRGIINEHALFPYARVPMHILCILKEHNASNRRCKRECVKYHALNLLFTYTFLVHVPIHVSLYYNMCASIVHQYYQVRVSAALSCACYEVCMKL